MQTPKNSAAKLTFFRKYKMLIINYYIVLKGCCLEEITHVVGLPQCVVGLPQCDSPT
jgi:hypothetical protein